MKYASVYNCSFHNLWFTSRFTFEVNQHVNRTYAVLSIINVGITGLEPATSRPPDVCATNCAKSRTLFA